MTILTGLYQLQTIINNYGLVHDQFQLANNNFVQVGLGNECS